MSWGAEILWKLGRSDEALALARQAAGRYPDDPEARAHLARYLWLTGRYSDAALELGDRRFASSQAAWQGPFAEAFVQAFEKLPTEKAIGAFERLREQKIGYWSLEMLPEKVGAEGRFELAFRLFDRLPGIGAYEYPWSKARAYQYLRKWKGDEAAREWILANFNPKLREGSMIAFFAAENYELLWLLQEPDAEPSSQTWLLRAAGAGLEGIARHPHREALLAHFQKPGIPQDLRFHIGCYLLGLESEDALLGMPRAPQDDDELAYFLGLKGYFEGRLEDAGDWLQLVPLRGKRFNYVAESLKGEIAGKIWRGGLSPGPGRPAAAR